MRNGQAVADPSDTDQFSEAENKQMGPIGVENVD